VDLLGRWVRGFPLDECEQAARESRAAPSVPPALLFPPPVSVDTSHHLASHIPYGEDKAWDTSIRQSCDTISKDTDS
jgi:hypothetical protein